jgi:hypothetical protein
VNGFGIDSLPLHGAILGMIFEYLFMSRTPFTAGQDAHDENEMCHLGPAFRGPTQL